MKRTFAVMAFLAILPLFFGVGTARAWDPSVGDIWIALGRPIPGGPTGLTVGDIGIALGKTIPGGGIGYSADMLQGMPISRADVGRVSRSDQGPEISLLGKRGGGPRGGIGRIIPWWLGF